jgi:hypothetical protein
VCITIGLEVKKQPLFYSQPIRRNQMAKTKEDKKKVHVPEHKKTIKGKKVKVKEHYRSTPN